MKPDLEKIYSHYLMPVTRKRFKIFIKKNKKPIYSS